MHLFRHLRIMHSLDASGIKFMVRIIGRTESQMFGSGSGLLDPEGKENKKPVLGKRASSFFGLINKSENALGGDRASTLGILGRGKSPAYDVPSA